MIRSLFLSAAAAAAGLGFYARYVEPGWVETTHTALRIRDLPGPFEAYRIVHISDIHMDTWMPPARLRRIVDTVNALRPDLVAITGDFVSYDPDRVREVLVAELCRLDARDGVVAVPGNHDYGLNHDNVRPVRDILQRIGLSDLSNDFSFIERGQGGLFVAGLDSVIAQQANLHHLLLKMPPEYPSVLLAHEPDVADMVAQSARFALQLSGHTHGGQIRMPWLGAPYAAMHGRRYQMGLLDVAGMHLYVTRGLGMIHLPLRFNCRPEIALLTLHRA